MTEESSIILKKNIKSVQTALFSINVDYASLHAKFVSTSKENEEMKDITSYKLEMIDKSIEKVHLGLEETDILLTVSDYLQLLDIDKMRIRMQVKRLLLENEWLRGELETLHARICQLDGKLTTQEAENQHYQFLCEMRKFAEDDTTKLFDKDVKKVAEENDINDDEIPPRMQSLYNLVTNYAKQGRFEVAIPLCKQALHDLKATNGENHPDVATMLTMTSMVYRDQGNVKEAAALSEEVLSIREQHFGKNHIILSNTLNQLTIFNVRLGKFKEAEAFCKRALLIKLKHFGDNHMEVAKQYNNLALLCQCLDKNDEVEKLFDLALDIYKSNSEYDDNINITKTKNNKVTFYIKEMHYSKAEVLLKEIITDYYLKYTEDDVEPKKPVWLTIEKFGQGANKKEKVYHAAECILSDYGRMTDPAIMSTLKHLINVYRLTNKQNEANILMEWLNMSLKTKKQNSPQLEPISFADDKPDDKKQKSIKNLFTSSKKRK